MDAPDIKTPLPGPKARAIIERDAPVRVAVLHARLSARHRPRRRRRRRGRGRQPLSRLRRRHRGQLHRRLASRRRRRPSADQAQKFIHMSGTDFYYEPQVRLAEELAAIVPIDGDGPHRSSATPAPKPTEAAIKLSRYHTKRQGIIAFLGCVPWTLDGVAVADGEQGGPAPRIRAVHAGRLSRAVSGPVSLQGQRRTHARPSASSFIDDQLLVHLVAPDEVAAIVVEPIQGEGGYIVPPAGVPAGPARARDASTASCWSSTKCSRAWDARGRCSRRSTSA